MTIELNDEARKVLDILAREYYENPETRLHGIHPEILGAKTGLYLNFSLYANMELIDNGLASRVDALNSNSNILITERGLKHAHPKTHRLRVWPKWKKILSLVTFIAAIITIIECINKLA